MVFCRIGCNLLVSRDKSSLGLIWNANMVKSMLKKMLHLPLFIIAYLFYASNIYLKYIYSLKKKWKTSFVTLKIIYPCRDFLLRLHLRLIYLYFYLYTACNNKKHIYQIFLNSSKEGQKDWIALKHTDKAISFRIYIVYGVGDAT